jgi:hypothetical protein
MKFKLNTNTVLFAAIIILLILLLKECGSSTDLKSQVERHQQNEKALLDTIRETKNRAGEIQTEKLTLIATKKELEKLNAELAAEVAKQKGNVLQLTSTNASLKSQNRGLRTLLEQIPDNQDITIVESPWPKNYKLSWGMDTMYSSGNFKQLEGFTRLTLLNDSTVVPGLTDITKDVNGFKIVTGLTKEGDDYKIFVKSDHPNFGVSDIEGAIIPGKNNPLFGSPKKWGLGATVGPNISYGFGSAGPSVYVGIGVTFGINYRVK